MSVPLIYPALIFGGFFLNNGDMPYYLDWMRFLSWFMYCNEAYAINQWHGVYFNTTICNWNKTIPDHHLMCSGDDVLDFFQFNPVRFDKYIQIVIIGDRIDDIVSFLGFSRARPCMLGNIDGRISFACLPSIVQENFPYSINHYTMQYTWKASRLL